MAATNNDDFSSIELLAQNLKGLLADYVLSAKRVKKKGLDSPQAMAKELAENVYPSFTALVEVMQSIVGELDSLDNVVQELADQTEDYLSLAAHRQLTQTILNGAQLVEILNQMVPAIEDDLSKRRVEEIIKNFERNAEMSIQIINDAAGEGDDESDDDSDDESTDDESTDDESTDESTDEQPEDEQPEDEKAKETTDA